MNDNIPVSNFVARAVVVGPRFLFIIVLSTAISSLSLASLVSRTIASSILCSSELLGRRLVCGLALPLLSSPFPYFPCCDDGSGATSRDIATGTGAAASSGVATVTVSGASSGVTRATFVCPAIAGTGIFLAWSSLFLLTTPVFLLPVLILLVPPSRNDSISAAAAAAAAAINGVMFARHSTL